MTLDLRAKPWTVSVGGLNCTAIAQNLTIRFDQLSPRGICGVTGTLTLGAYPDTFPEALNPRTNPGRWAPGVAVAVTVTISGTAYALPFKLSILKRPAAPYPNQPTLEIQVGDDFALLGFRQAEGDSSGVTLGTATTPTTVINALLSAAGVPALAGTVPEYSLNYPIQKLSTESFLNQAGAIVFARNRYLWQAANGAIQAPAITFTGLSPVATYTVGTNEADYFPVDNDEAPPETLVVTCISQNVEANSDPAPITDTTRDPEDGNAIVEETTQSLVGRASSLPFERTRTRTQARILFPAAFANGQLGGRNLRLSSDVTTQSFFDSKGRLSLRIEREWQPRGKALPSFYPTLPNAGYERLIREKVTRWFYDASDLATLVQTRVTEAEGLVSPSTATSPDNLREAELLIETWLKLKGDRWLYTQRRIDRREGGTGARTTTDPNSDGPPATQYKEPNWLTTDKEVKGSATFAPLAGASYRPTPEPLVLSPGTAVSDAQCAAVANTWGRIRHGRAFAVTFAAPLTAAWLTSFAPVRRVDFTNGGVRTAYLTDGLSLVLAETEAVIAGDGIELGVVATEGATPAPPFRPVLGLVGGARVGGTVSTELPPTPIAMVGGVRFGGAIDLAT
jgi:hypothetical protein